MKRVENIWVGWLEANIANFIKDLPDLITSSPYLLITRLDSSQNLRTLRNIERIVQEIPGCRFVDEALAITGREFLKFSELYNKLNGFDLFNGFDELWLFRSAISIEKPSRIWITGPLEIINEIPPGLSQWMTTSGCTLGLGDGIGLNYVTNDKHIADLLEMKYIVKDNN